MKDEYRLKSAIDLPEITKESSTSDNLKNQESESVDSTGDNENITTQEELEAFYIVKSILRENIDTQQIKYKDTKSYFSLKTID